MTRIEFIQDVTDWYDLLEFCHNEDCDICEDIYSEEGKDDHFNGMLVEMARNADTWQDLYDRLEEIPNGYGHYITDGYDWLRIAEDDDFVQYKDDVLEWGDENDIWEDEYEDEDYVEDEGDVEEEDDDFEAVEGCTLKELFVSGISCLHTITVEENTARDQEEIAFKSLFSVAERKES